jgi:hypothetical protein
MARPDVLPAAWAVGWVGGGLGGSRAGRATVVRCARGAEALASGAEVPGFGTVKVFWHAGHVSCTPEYPKSPAKCWPQVGHENLYMLILRNSF